MFESHVGEIELAFSNAMHHLDAGDRNSRIPKAFEAEHRIDPSFDVAMIFLDPGCSSTSTIATSCARATTHRSSFRAPRGETPHSHPA